VTIRLQPFMPTSTSRLLEAIGPPGSTVSTLDPLFPKQK
jgi:hypothetical protein